MKWSEYWELVKEKLDSDDDNWYKSSDPEVKINVKKMFKDKWRKGIDVDNAYYDILGLI